MSIILNPKPGNLLYMQLDELSKKEKMIIHRLIELGVTIKNPSEDDPTIAVEVPHNFAEPINIEIGFLLNELSSGDFATNLLGIRSGKKTALNIKEIKQNDIEGIRFADSYPSYLKYYVYRFEDEDSSA